METSSTAAIPDNTATIHPLSGIDASSDVNDAKTVPLTITSSAGNGVGGPNSGQQHASIRAQQSKLTNETAASGIQNQKTSSSQINGNVKQRKAAAGVELKSMIIEFMRDKPYLWNRWHPGYNDNKRRENEFSLFSQEISYPVAEIKRVWHVLRTNFFRAHKIQAEKVPIVMASGGDDKGERCWKYYQSMKFILDGSPSNNVAQNESRVNNYNNNNNVSMNEDTSSSAIDVRQTRSSKVMKGVGGDSKRLVQRMSNQSLANHSSDSNSNNSSGVPSTLLIIPSTTATPAILTTPTSTVSMASDTSVVFSSGAKSNSHSRGHRAHHDNGHDTNSISPDQFGVVQGRSSSYSSFNGMSRISFDADDDHLYARSLTATLKKFDPTTKEVIKLKFQEIIVEYMQKQQHQSQQLQQQHHHHQQQQQTQLQSYQHQAQPTTTQSKQTQE